MSSYAQHLGTVTKMSQKYECFKPSKYVFFYDELIELGKLEALEWVETGAWGGLSLTFIVPK